MKKLNFKSVAFYVTSISLVIILFKVVTAYGESTIKAPATIEGRYHLTLKKSLGCLSTEPLKLNLQQSGIYLNGSLFAANDSAQSKVIVVEKPSLTGKWNNPKLLLSGSVPHLPQCKNQSVIIQGLIDREKLQGKIAFSDGQNSVNFTAQREVTIKPENYQNQH